MARGINKVILIGNVGKDPDVRYTTSGAAITTLSVATSEQWTDKQTQEKKEHTEWHRVKFFGRLAEIAGEYLRKGSQVYIEGRLKTDKYTDKEGIERYATDIVANEMQMLGGRPGGSENAARGDDERGARSSAPARAGVGEPGRDFSSRPASAPAAVPFEDDEIPF